MMSASPSSIPLAPTTLSVLVVDAEGTVVQWSPGSSATFGWSEEAALGKDLGELGVIDWSDEGGETLLGAVSAGVAWVGTHRAQREDGTILTVESSVVPFGSEHKRLAVITSVENSPRTVGSRGSPHRQQDLIDGIDLPIVGVDAEGLITVWNPACERVYGYSAEECIGRTVEPLIGVDCEAIDPLQRIRDAGNSSVDVELVGRHKNGSPLNLIHTFSPVFDDGGDLAGYTIVARDLEERNQLLAQIKLERDRLVQAQAAGQVGSFELDLRTGKRWCSVEYCRLHGAPVDAPLEREEWLARIHPADRATAERLSRQVRETGEPVVFDYRVLTPAGGERKIEISISADLDESGSPVRLHGTALDVTARSRASHQLEQLAYNDPLTGLANRAALSNEVERILRRAQRDGTQVAIFFLDIDRMKVINDGMGHAAGDELLIQLSHRLRQSVRPGDLLARFAGDEFVVVCSGVGEADARELARRIAASVQDPFEVQNRELFVTVSIGIALSSGIDTTESLLNHADAAMYRSKAGGRGAEVFFDEEMARQALARLEMESGLQRALSKRQFDVRYQPIVNVVSGEMEAVEGLLRWRRAPYELTPPDAFLPLAEEIGLMGEIGRWGLGRALEDLRGWRERSPGSDGLRVAVNLSASELQDPGLVDAVAAAIAAAEAEASALELEITESVLMEDIDLSINILSRLREQGVRISIDDFGTGHSSLSYLQRLPVTALKIDRSFVVGLDDSADDHSRKIVETILSLARSLDLDVIAEGVETRAQLAALASLGVPRAQGFLWSPAIPANEIDAWLPYPSVAS